MLPILVGSRCGPFDVALDALANGLIALEPLVADTFDLDDGVRALERAGEAGVLEALLRIGEAVHPI
jgi:alcohol dehydrogenase